MCLYMSFHLYCICSNEINKQCCFRCDTIKHAPPCHNNNFFVKHISCMTFIIIILLWQSWSTGMINIANNLKVTHNLQSISSKTSKEELENAINKYYAKQLSYRIKVSIASTSVHVSYRSVNKKFEFLRGYFKFS